jgi:hypothetical protein
MACLTILLAAGDNSWRVCPRQVQQTTRRTPRQPPSRGERGRQTVLVGAGYTPRVRHSGSVSEQNPSVNAAGEHEMFVPSQGDPLHVALRSAVRSRHHILLFARDAPDSLTGTGSPTPPSRPRYAASQSVSFAVPFVAEPRCRRERAAGYGWFRQIRRWTPRWRGSERSPGMNGNRMSARVRIAMTAQTSASALSDVENGLT